MISGRTIAPRKIFVEKGVYKSDFNNGQSPSPKRVTKRKIEGVRVVYKFRDGQRRKARQGREGRDAT